MVSGKHVERAETEALKEEANRLLAKGDHRRALALNEAVTSIDRSDCGSWLDAAQSAMELRLGLRTLELLKEAEPLCGGTELERWVNLESEALRQEERRCRVAQVVEAGVWELGSSESLVEGPGDRRGVMWLPEHRGEDVAAVAPA